MKNKLFLFGTMLILIAEMIALILFAVRVPAMSQDAVTVNQIVQTVTDEFHALEEHKNSTALDYVVIDNDGKLLFKTRSGLSESMNAAIVHRDTILDITLEEGNVGKLIVYNDGAQILRTQKQAAVAVLSAAIGLQAAVCIGYALYLHVSVIKPFRGLKGFAERVAGGNLDVPLEMDRRNLFGAFTESFDIMRSELKKARIAEAQAQQSKKELVAKLSHDIKTPVASIKAVSEVGLALTRDEKDRANYTQIIGKADQINTLVSNLFTATLEELQQLSVTPVNIESRQIKTMLKNADYLHRAAVPYLPDCLVCVDPLRLQQVFDNLFANAYKYAATDIWVRAESTEGHINISIEDMGGGVPAEELPLLKEKFKRGSNAANTEGAGLGLYISDYLMREMGGELIVENGAHGLQVSVCIPLSGK